MYPRVAVSSSVLENEERATSVDLEGNDMAPVVPFDVCVAR